MQDVECLTSRPEYHCWSFKKGLAKVLLNAWQPGQRHSECPTRSSATPPSPSPPPFVQWFYVLYLDWQHPIFHSEPWGPDLFTAKRLEDGHQPLLITFLQKEYEPQDLQDLKEKQPPNHIWFGEKPFMSITGALASCWASAQDQFLSYLSSDTENQTSTQPFQHLSINPTYLSSREHPHVGF